MLDIKMQFIFMAAKVAKAMTVYMLNMVQILAAIELNFHAICQMQVDI